MARGATLLASAMLASAASAASPALPPTAPKYIFYVLVDDLGYGSVGWNRKNYPNPIPDIQTPNMDALAEEGVVLTRHYVHSMCTPSRSALQSGRLPVHVQQTLENPEVVYSGIPMNMTTIAGKLKEAGYRRHVVGKWDVGLATYVSLVVWGGVGGLGSCGPPHEWPRN